MLLAFAKLEVLFEINYHHQPIRLLAFAKLEMLFEINYHHQPKD